MFLTIGFCIYANVVYSYTYSYKQKHNDDFNERTHPLLNKNIPLTLYSKELMLLVCEGSWRRRQTTTFWPKVILSTIASLLPRLGWAAQAWVAESPSPLSEVGSHSAGILSPTATATRTLCHELTQTICGTWLYNCLTSTCFLWAYASAPNSTTSTDQGNIPISSTGCTFFRCSSAYLHRCIYCLTARSRVLRATLNKTLRKHPTRHQLYCHLPPITKTIQVRRSRDELICDVLLWTPTYDQAKAGRPAQTYIQQLCENTGCSSEDLPEAMNDSGERGSGISVLAARHDDDDDDDLY